MARYTSLEALLHDAFWAEEESPELDWTGSLLGAGPGPALEVGCGSGRLLLPLLQRGHLIEGLEPSGEMLDLCRRAAADLGLEPVLHQGGMENFAPGKTYAAVLIPAFTFQLAEDPEAAMANLAALTRGGGQLYLTVFTPWAELNGEVPEGEWYRDQEITLHDGRHATLDTRFRLDLDRQTLHREHHYELEGPEGTLRHESEQTIRWFEPMQLHRLLTDAGFEPETAVADFDEEIPVDDDAQIITVIARKA